jgi:hypothetical protein
MAEPVLFDSNRATTPKKRTQVAWVKDKAGNEFVCAMDAHKNPNNRSKEELKSCIVDAKSPQPFAGGSLQ